MNEITVSIKDLFYRILSKWRVMVVFALIFAIAGGAFSYVSSYKSSQKAYDEFMAGQVEDEDTEGDKELNAILNLIEETGSVLNSTEKKQVENAFESYKDFTEQINQIQNYLNKSVKMNLNPNAVPTMTLQYLVDNHYEAVYPVIEYTDFTEDIISSYNAKILNTNTCQQILNQIEWETDIAYVRELISVNKSANNIMTIRIYAPDEATCEAIAVIIQQAIVTETPGVKKLYGDFDLSFIHKQYSLNVVSDILSTKQGYVANMNTIAQAYANVEKNLSKNQISYYDAIVNAYLHETMKTDAESTDSKSVNPEAETILDMVETEVEETAPVVRGKLDIIFVILGFIGGVVIVCGVYFLIYIFGRNIRNEDDIREVFGVRVLGTVNAGEKKKLFGFIDRWLGKLFYKRRYVYSNEERYEMITSGARISMAKNNLSKVFVTGVSADEDSRKFAEKLAETLGANSGKSVLDDPVSLEKMSESDGIVLVERIGESSFDDIRKELELVKENNIKVIGAVVIC
ncbi:MAG: hypothetical protein Q4C42_09440 [Clostridia bacterium]|nr:hypothetical protein [Clostridia bacterium]